MRNLDELQRLYDRLAPAPAERGRVDLLVVRTAPGEHETPEAAELTPAAGVVGDRWVQPLLRDEGRQVTLMRTAVAEIVCDGQPLHLPGDNVLVDLDLSADNLPVGARLRVGTALLEVTKKPHLGCKKFSQRFGADATRWVNTDDAKVQKLRGINCRVVEAGSVSLGGAVEVVSREPAVQ
jgi:hypothetical protein